MSLIVKRRVYTQLPASAPSFHIILGWEPYGHSLFYHSEAPLCFQRLGPPDLIHQWEKGSGKTNLLGSKLKSWCVCVYANNAIK